VTLLPPNTATRMPRIAHFIFGLSPDFGNKPFSLVHYLAIRSAHDRLGTDWKIFVSGRAAAATAQRQPLTRLCFAGVLLVRAELQRELAAVA
jgi:hypothetical protein